MAEAEVVEAVVAEAEVVHVPEAAVAQPRPDDRHL